MAKLNDVLAILARHTTFQDQGDRATVADFLGRDSDDPNCFGPQDTDDTDDNGQDVRNEDNDQHTPDKVTPGNRADAGTAKTATAKPGTHNR